MKCFPAVFAVLLLAVPLSLCDSSDAEDCTETIPSKYDMREHYELSPVGDQGMYGICYGVAVASALETALIRDGMHMDVSQLYLVARNYFENDEGACLNPTNRPSFEGGDPFMVVQRIASDNLVLPEETVPSSDISDDYSVGDLGTVLYVTDYDYISGKNEVDRDTIKRYVMEGKEVMVNMGFYGYGPRSYVGDDGLLYATMSCDGEGMNHGVSIVGWDDDLEGDYFGLPEDQKGAWLVKNTWGDPVYDEFSGYFLMSYSQLIGNIIVLNSLRMVEGSFHLYSYDPVPGQSTVSTRRAANMFIATGDEIIDGISFANFSEEMEYTARVYVGCSNGDPESGRCLFTVSRTSATAGQNYIALPEPVKVFAGQCFSVVVDTGDDTKFNVEKDFQGSIYQMVAVAGPGESFYYVDGTWVDCCEEYGGNLRIKAYSMDDDGSIPVTGVRDGSAFSATYRSDTDMYLRDLSFGSFMPGSAYKVSVYLDPDNGVPGSGKLLGCAIGVTDDDGSATAVFSRGIAIREGQQYTLVLEFEDGTSYIPVLSSYDDCEYGYLSSEGTWCTISSGGFGFTIGFRETSFGTPTSSAAASVLVMIMVIFAAACACIQAIRARD